MKVMIVDDEADIRDTLADFLSDEGYEVVTAGDGRRALSHLAAGEVPCVIILDLIMPVMNGNELYEHLQQDARLSGVPVIVTTSDPSRAPAGPVTMTKPIDLGRLLTRVREHCLVPG